MFPKNIKSILIVVMLLVMILGSVVLYAECDKIALISKDGFLISNIEDPDGDTPDDFDDPVDFFDYIRERSVDYYSSWCQYVSAYKENDDGYGFSYYKENDYNIPCYYPDIWNPLNQTWYLHGENNVYYQGEVLNIPPQANWPLNVTESMVINYINYSTYYQDLQDNDSNTATILLGHARQGTGGTGNHPFRFEHNNRTYIFMHNGGLDDDFIDALEAYLPSLENEQWFANHLPNWGQGSTPQIGSLVDTELLFHYIMSFIIDNDNDIISGIHDAIIQTDIEGCNIRAKIENGYTNVINFVLSDGENLYVFRNSPSSDSWHELSYKDNDTFYSVKTLDPRGGNIMNKHDCVILSRDEEPIVYSRFMEMKIFSEGSEGYNWDSFPLLVRDAATNEAIDIVPILETIEPFDDIELINFVAVSDELTYNINNNPLWQPYQNYDIQSTRLYKIKADPYMQRTLELSGTRMETDYELEYSLYPNAYQWLGYWLPESQNIVDAFGDLWQYVEKVKSEDWYYNKCSIIRGDPFTTVSWSTENKTLEYGKGYMVWFKDTPPITNFQWTTSGTTEEPKGKAASESFTYIEKADYEVIDVVNIPSNVTEIGVFEDEVCVGAVVVEDSCAQILVYSDNANRDPIPFNYEIVTGRGFSTPIKDYLVLNQATGEFEPSVIISGRQGYSVIKLGEQEEPENIVAIPILLGNYPNPFNPTTAISFSLSHKEDIELTIYNIKGQKIKTLYSGIADVGEHTITWSGKDTNDKSVGSGIYFYKLKTNNKELTRKMIMMK